MAIKKYGIFLAYPPMTDLRAEGLGRYLAAFLKATQRNADIHFVIGCPSWLKQTLQELCLNENIDLTRFEILKPRRNLVILSVLLNLSKIFSLFKSQFINFTKLSKKFKTNFFDSKKQNFIKSLFKKLSISFFSMRSGFLTSVIFTLLVAPILLLLFATLVIVFALLNFGYNNKEKLKKFTVKKNKQKQSQGSRSLKTFSIVRHVYQLAATGEFYELVRLINQKKDIAAWYSPAAFWPEFNLINVPKLICVPDVVLADFPVTFAYNNGERFLTTFPRLEDTIKLSQNFVTYSQYVKEQTLVRLYNKSPEQIYVVPHAPNTLHEWIDVTGFPDNSVVRRHYCQMLLNKAMKKSRNAGYCSNFANPEMKFFFYASQFRPNKNVMTLLRAFKFLLQKRYVGHKLILTGNPLALKGLENFILENNIYNDVIFLDHISTAELAACYALADIAVNPSLSEGGCPFTFTEALSVNTPVVMARIPVTEEVLHQPELEPMYFDPYDWRSMADRMEWAVKNREYLLKIQKPIYNDLTKRSWNDVVDEHLAILDKISN